MNPISSIRDISNRVVTDSKKAAVSNIVKDPLQKVPEMAALINSDKAKVINKAPVIIEESKPLIQKVGEVTQSAASHNKKEPFNPYKAQEKIGQTGKFLDIKI